MTFVAIELFRCDLSLMVTDSEFANSDVLLALRTLPFREFMVLEVNFRVYSFAALVTSLFFLPIAS